MPFLYYSVTPMWWSLSAPLVGYQYTDTQPPDFTLDFGIFYLGVFYPAGYTYTWVISAVTPTDTGWWASMDEEFSGQSNLLNQARPKDPRTFHDISVWAASTAGALGGFPGPSAVFNNHLLYAAGGYVAGTDNPTIRIFDGTFDREVVRLPNVGGVTIPKGVMTMLTANGTVYVTTFDSGTTSADWSGRVFSLSIETGQLTPIGPAFPAGHMPYALAWHMGRLWCGTNRQVSTASGKVFWFRPKIDTVWTEDKDLSTAPQAGVASMLSFKGQLYVGCTAAAGTFAKVLVRDALGTWSTSDTGSGGTAIANNGFYALAEFKDKLYATFWNNDTTAVAKIRKFDNSSWSTSYTGASTTLVPFVGLPVDSGVLLAIGGGMGKTAALITTPDGVTWSDRSVFLTQGSPTSTGLPVFGTVVR